MHPDDNGIACPAYSGARLPVLAGSCRGTVHRVNNAAETRNIIVASKHHFLHDNRELSSTRNQSVRRHIPKGGESRHAENRRCARGQYMLSARLKFPSHGFGGWYCAGSRRRWLPAARWLSYDRRNCRRLAFERYLDCGIRLFNTSAPYSATPATRPRSICGPRGFLTELTLKRKFL